MSERKEHDSDDGLRVNHDFDDILSALLSLGNLYSDQWKLDQAEEMYMRALRGDAKALGANPVSTYIPAPNTCQNLGRLLATLDRFEDAVGYYRRALVGLQKVLGPSHDRCGQIENAIKLISKDQGTPFRS